MTPVHWRLLRLARACVLCLLANCSLTKHILVCLTCFTMVFNRPRPQWQGNDQRDEPEPVVESSASWSAMTPSPTTPSSTVGRPAKPLYEFTWNIQDFGALDIKSSRTPLYSDQFALSYLPELSFCLELYPAGVDTGCVGHASVYLSAQSNRYRSVRVTVSLAATTRRGEREVITAQNQLLPIEGPDRQGWAYGSGQFIKHDVIMKPTVRQWNRDDVPDAKYPLVITCKIFRIHSYEIRQPNSNGPL